MAVPPFLTIAEAARLIQSRELSPVELTEALLIRIAAIDPQLDAFITVTGDLALAQARAAESEIGAGRYRGALHGIPIGLKDIYNTAGILTSGHSRICIDNRPARDATAVAKLHAAGTVLMGKLATHEFAHGGPSFDLPWPPARNPWNPERFSGGSSSGPGAAIAAGLVLGALGSDTGGSIRGPAFLSGVVGFKPTYGLVSRSGVLPHSHTLDTCGPMAWTVEDCAILLQAIVGHDAQDPTSVAGPPVDFRGALQSDIRGLRIGVIRHFWEGTGDAGDELCSAMDAALDVLRHLGAAVEDVRMRSLEEYRDVKTVIGESEVFAIYYRDLVERPGDFGADFLGRILAGCLFDGSDYVQAQRMRRRMIAEMAPLYDRYDAFVTVGSGPAPRLDAHRTVHFWQKHNNTNPFNVTGGPALGLCCGFSHDGLPLGMQIAGRPFDDATVLKVGHAYERATPWRERRPLLTPGAAKVPVTPPKDTFGEISADAKMRGLAADRARSAGLRLSEAQMEYVYGAAPYALAIRERIRGDFGWDEEGASVFRFPE